MGAHTLPHSVPLIVNKAVSERYPWPLTPLPHSVPLIVNKAVSERYSWELTPSLTLYLCKILAGKPYGSGWFSYICLHFLFCLFYASMLLLM